MEVTYIIFSFLYFTWSLLRFLLCVCVCVCVGVCVCVCKNVNGLSDQSAGVC